MTVPSTTKTSLKGHSDAVLANRVPPRPHRVPTASRDAVAGGRTRYRVPRVPPPEGGTRYRVPGRVAGRGSQLLNRVPGTRLTTLPPRRCDRCSRNFSPLLENMRWCRVCFHERAGDYDMALAEIAWEQGFNRGLEQSRLESDSSSEQIERSLGAIPIGDLIKLCHPDRHPTERQELANRITAWLNELRSIRER